VGDVVKVQTNLGWESVVIRLRRSNGRVDIQFKDGEYMRSVMPRYLKENGAPAIIREGSSASEGGGGGSNGGTSRGANTTSSNNTASNDGTRRAGASPDTAVFAGRSASSCNRGERSTSPSVTLASVRSRDASSQLHPAHFGRMRGSPWHGTSTTGNSMGNRGFVRGGGVLHANGSVSSTPRTTAPEADLQQQLKHLFRVRTVNI